MVEVVGTAPTSAMVITKFVYRHSWKTNKSSIAVNIEFTLFFLNKIEYYYKQTYRVKFNKNVSKKNTT